MLLLLFAALLQAAPPPATETVTVTVLATTDTHGSLYPWDYFTRQSAPRGLAAAATLVAQARRESPNTLLIDCGDTIQGSPLESVHQAAVRAGETRSPEPMMLAMNRMGYDAMVVGNHEFNFGLANLAAARETARFPWLSANTIGAVPPFAPYVVKTVGGVKVAIIGVTTAGDPAVGEAGERPRPLVARARGGRAAGARGAGAREAGRGPRGGPRGPRSRPGERRAAPGRAAG